MIKIILVSTVILMILPILTVTISAQELSPRIRAEQYMLQVKKHLEQGNHSKALEYMDKIINLKIGYPTDLLYYYARSQAKLGYLEAPKENLQKYLKLTGTNGKFYYEALALLSELEEKKKEKTENEERRRIEESRREQERIRDSEAAREQRIDEQISDQRKKYWWGIGLAAASYFLAESDSNSKKKKCEEEGIEEEQCDSSASVIYLGTFGLGAYMVLSAKTSPRDYSKLYQVSDNQIVAWQFGIDQKQKFSIRLIIKW